MGLNPLAPLGAKKELRVTQAELGMNAPQDAREEQLARPPSLRRPAPTRALSTEWIIRSQVLLPLRRRDSRPVVVLLQVGVAKILGMSVRIVGGSHRHPVFNSSVI